MLRVYFEEENGSRSELTWAQVNNNELDDILRGLQAVAGTPVQVRRSPNGWVPLEVVAR